MRLMWSMYVISYVDYIAYIAYILILIELYELCYRCLISLPLFAYVSMCHVSWLSYFMWCGALESQCWSSSIVSFLLQV